MIDRIKMNKPGFDWIPGGNVSTLTAKPYEPGKPWLSRIRNVPAGFVLRRLTAIKYENNDYTFVKSFMFYHLHVTFFLYTKIY